MRESTLKRTNDRDRMERRSEPALSSHRRPACHRRMICACDALRVASLRAGGLVIYSDRRTGLRVCVSGRILSVHVRVQHLTGVRRKTGFAEGLRAATTCRPICTQREHCTCNFLLFNVCAIEKVVHFSRRLERLEHGN